jgi:hypothetical protein
MHLALAHVVSHRRYLPRERCNDMSQMPSPHSDHVIRLYINPVKYGLMLAFCVVLVLIVWSSPPTKANDLATSYFITALMAVAILVLLVILVRAAIVRQPVLQVDTRGWTYHPLFGQPERFVDWRDVGGVGSGRQSVRGVGFYSLVLYARLPQRTQRPHVRTLRLTPSIQETLLRVGLGFAYIWPTRSSSQQLVQRISREFSNEIRLHQIVVAEKANPLY